MTDQFKRGGAQGRSFLKLASPEPAGKGPRSADSAETRREMEVLKSSLPRSSEEQKFRQRKSGGEKAVSTKTKPSSKCLELTGGTKKLQNAFGLQNYSPSWETQGENSAELLKPLKLMKRSPPTKDFLLGPSYVQAPPKKLAPIRDDASKQLEDEQYISEFPKQTYATGVTSHYGAVAKSRISHSKSSKSVSKKHPDGKPNKNAKIGTCKKSKSPHRVPIIKGNNSKPSNLSNAQKLGKKMKNADSRLSSSRSSDVVRSLFNVDTLKPKKSKSNPEIAFGSANDSYKQVDNTVCKQLPKVFCESSDSSISEDFAENSDYSSDDTISVQSDDNSQYSDSFSDVTQKSSESSISRKSAADFDYSSDDFNSVQSDDKSQSSDSDSEELTEVTPRSFASSVSRELGDDNTYSSDDFISDHSSDDSISDDSILEHLADFSQNSPPSEQMVENFSVNLEDETKIDSNPILLENFKSQAKQKEMQLISANSKSDQTNTELVNVALLPLGSDNALPPLPRKGVLKGSNQAIKSNATFNREMGSQGLTKTWFWPNDKNKKVSFNIAPEENCEPEKKTSEKILSQTFGQANKSCAPVGSAYSTEPDVEMENFDVNEFDNLLDEVEAENNMNEKPNQSVTKMSGSAKALKNSSIVSRDDNFSVQPASSPQSASNGTIAQEKAISSLISKSNLVENTDDKIKTSVKATKQNFSNTQSLKKDLCVQEDVQVKAVPTVSNNLKEISMAQELPSLIKSSKTPCQKRIVTETLQKEQVISDLDVQETTDSHSSIAEEIADPQELSFASCSTTSINASFDGVDEFGNHNSLADIASIKSNPSDLSIFSDPANLNAFCKNAVKESPQIESKKPFMSRSPVDDFNLPAGITKISDNKVLLKNATSEIFTTLVNSGLDEVLTTTKKGHNVLTSKILSTFCQTSPKNLDTNLDSKTKNFSKALINDNNSPVQPASSPQSASKGAIAQEKSVSSLILKPKLQNTSIKLLATIPGNKNSPPPGSVSNTANNLAKSLSTSAMINLDNQPLSSDSKDKILIKQLQQELNGCKKEISKLNQEKGWDLEYIDALKKVLDKRNDSIEMLNATVEIEKSLKRESSADTTELKKVLALEREKNGKLTNQIKDLVEEKDNLTHEMIKDQEYIKLLSVEIAKETERMNKALEEEKLKSELEIGQLKKQLENEEQNSSKKEISKPNQEREMDFKFIDDLKEELIKRNNTIKLLESAAIAEKNLKKGLADSAELIKLLDIEREQNDELTKELQIKRAEITDLANEKDALKYDMNKDRECIEQLIVDIAKETERMDKTIKEEKLNNELKIGQIKKQLENEINTNKGLRAEIEHIAIQAQFHFAKKENQRVKEELQHEIQMRELKGAMLKKELDYASLKKALDKIVIENEKFKREFINKLLLNQSEIEKLKIGIQQKEKENIFLKKDLESIKSKSEIAVEKVKQKLELQAAEHKKEILKFKRGSETAELMQEFGKIKLVKERDSAISMREADLEKFKLLFDQEKNRADADKEKLVEKSQKEIREIESDEGRLVSIFSAQILNRDLVIKQLQKDLEIQRQKPGLSSVTLTPEFENCFIPKLDSVAIQNELKEKNESKCDIDSTVETDMQHISCPTTSKNCHEDLEQFWKKI